MAGGIYHSLQVIVILQVAESYVSYPLHFKCILAIKPIDRAEYPVPLQEVFGFSSLEETEITLRKYSQSCSIPLGFLIFSIPCQTPPPYNQNQKLFLSKQKKRKNGRKKKSPVPALAVLGVVPTDIVDPEIHRQTGRRPAWAGIGNIGCVADDHRDRRNP